MSLLTMVSCPCTFLAAPLIAGGRETLWHAGSCLRSLHLSACLGCSFQAAMSNAGG